MQHLNGHQQFHRRALEKRQIRRVTTTVVTEPETTFTSTFTTRVPLIQIPGLGDDEDEETTTTSRRSSSSSSPSSSSTRPASSSAATARPTASSSVAPSSAISSAATSRPTAPSSSSSLTDIVTSFVTETNSRALPTTSDIASNSTAVGGAKSAGQVAGIVVGVLAGVIGVAIFAAFIVRHMKKRANDKEAWDAAKFRQSALLLNDEKPGGGGAGRGGPRPPSMIERREGSVMNVPPPSRAYPYTDVPGSPAGFMPQDQLGYNRVATPHQPQQYGAPNPYGAAPMAYTGQNMYGQGAERGYGGGNMNAGFGAAGAGYGQPQQGMEHPGFPRQNGAHNSLPPFASYAPRLEMDGHSFGPAGAVGNMSRTNTTASALPNPFSERGHPTPRDSSSAGHGTSESGGQHNASNRSRFMTRNGDEDDVQDQRDAPPAYIDDGSYAKMQRDVKTPVVMSVEGTAPTPAPVAPPKPTTPAPAPAPTSTTPAPAAAMGNNKARPMSSHTVYDPSDAYGGM